MRLLPRLVSLVTGSNQVTFLIEAIHAIMETGYVL